MNYHNITKDDMLNGTGLRVVLWVSGCEMRCPACHNPETHDKDSGILFDKQAEIELLNELKYDYISGITFTGGHPLMECNRPEILRLVKKIKKLYPNKNIWLYTGYTWEEIQDIPSCKEIVDLIDVLVDGRFVLYLKDTSLHWKGSKNQRVIDVQKSIKNKKIVLFDE